MSSKEFIAFFLAIRVSSATFNTNEGKSRGRHGVI